MKIILAAIALGAALLSTGTTIADTHLAAPKPAYSRIPGSETTLLRMARQDEACLEAACAAQHTQCQRTQSSSDCNKYSVCMQSARETGQCDN